MPNSSARTGTYYESKAKRMLEDLGYVVIRAAGSKGPFDLVAIGPRDIRCIQVKAGVEARISPAEREVLKDAAVPEAICTKEIWRMKRRQPPMIERL